MTDTHLMDIVVRDAHFAHQRRLIEFSTILAVTGAVGDGEVARVVEADAKASLSMGVPVEVARYAAAVDLATHPLTGRAAIEWHARSLHEIDEIPIDEARRIAAEAFSAGPARPVAVGATGSTRRSRGRRRAAMSAGVAGVARVPWISIVAVILALGFLSSTGWSLYMTAREAEERANAASEYERGRADLEREQTSRALTLLEEAERLRAKAEQAEAETQEAWDEAVAAVGALLDAAEADMSDGHFVDGFERLRVLEDTAHACVNLDPSLVEEFYRTRTDEAVMPALEWIYRIDEFGGAEVMEEVRNMLRSLDDRVPDQRGGRDDGA